MTRATAPRYGLVAAGSAGRSILASLPSLRRHLGPVASSTVKAASRIANALKAGSPARDMSAFHNCTAIVACAPDTGLDRVAALLDDSRFDWSGKVLLFCDSSVSSLDFPQYRERGAFLGSLNSIQGFEHVFVMEGHKNALREAKRFAKEAGGVAHEVEAKQMPLFDSALTISSSLFTPLIDLCVECIQHSGIDRKTAVHLAEGLFLLSLRSYLHSGRRGWTGPVAAHDEEAVRRQYEAICELSGLRGEYFRMSAEFAFRLYKSFPELARYLPKG